MKLVVVVVALIALASARSLDAEETLFKSYMETHNKVYTPREYPHRLAAFRENLRRIERLNKDPHAHYGLNQFSDMTVAEFKSKMLMTPFSGSTTCQWPFNGSVTINPVNAPKSFDWRTKGAVTPVKDQQQCGSCWTFSVSGNIEGQHFLSKGNLVSLSEQEIVDCSKSCLASQPDLCDAGCGGGLPWLAYQDIINQGGLPTEASYPYTGNDGTCQTNNWTAAATISSWTAVGTDVAVIEAYLAAHGPLSICLNADLLMSYQSGIITSASGSCPGDESDHAVLLVGYGTDPESGVHYWIVKNSWNTSWGEQGYFRIAADAVQGESLCGINLCVTSAVA